MNIFLPYSIHINSDELYECFQKYSKLNTIIIYDSPFKKVSSNENNSLIFTEENFEQTKFKQHFPKNKYIVTLDFFTEAQYYNPYYNQKACIAANGDIKNCLLHDTTFGNVKDNILSDVVVSNQFQLLWHANHDKIVDIKDNELRYCMMVSDNLKHLPIGLYTIDNTV